MIMEVCGEGDKMKPTAPEVHLSAVMSNHTSIGGFTEPEQTGSFETEESKVCSCSLCIRENCSNV